MVRNAIEEYWSDFYQRNSAGAPAYPSQFAAFAINEFCQVDSVVEFGCGNGRDSFFFASNGFRVLALDESEQAVDLCRVRGQHDCVAYHVCRASDATSKVEDFLRASQRAAVYARFFLHAIDEVEQQKFFDLLRCCLPVSSLLFLEYRTTEDALQEKIFGSGHYRRYLEHSEIVSKVTDAGFSVIYQIEGRGLAKYKDEDAKVGRCVAIKGGV